MVSSKVAVIGAGRIGALFEQDRLRPKPATHLGAWLQLGAEVSVAEPVDTRRQLIADGYPDVRSYKDYTQMLAHQGPFDVISVATPPETHEAIVEEIAERKAAKVVFCEKPIAPSLPEARNIVAACERSGIKLAVNHTRRWEFSWRYGAGLIALKALGEVIGSVAYYVGDYIEAGTHMADLLNWYGLESQVYNLKGTEYLIFELDVFFQRGRLRISDNGRLVEQWWSLPSRHYEYYEELQVQIPSNVDIRKFPATIEQEGNTPMLVACRQLQECAIKQTGNPLCTGADGLKALERALKWERFAAHE